MAEKRTKTMINILSLITTAREMAAVAHQGQVIEGTDIPYIAHCAQVAGLVQAATEGHTRYISMVAAAWLHDSLEDTDLTFSDIKEETSDQIASYVLDLTDQKKDGSRSERKLYERLRLGNACFEVQTIKLADIIANLTYSETLKPSFRGVYIDEKMSLILELSNQPAETQPLWKHADKVARDAWAAYMKDAA